MLATTTRQRVDLRPLWYWMEEREAIRVRKERGDPWPWTDNPILRQYRFCNVRREDDKVTRWIKANIRQPYADHPNLWFMLCIARQINLPATLEQLIATPGAWPVDGEFRPERMVKVCQERTRVGLPWHTSAYMIRAESDPKREWYSWPKARYVAEIVLGRLWNERTHLKHALAKDAPSLYRVHSLILACHGWGPFTAYQAVVDMRFTALLNRAKDVETWAAAGPGTVRGLNRIHGRPLNAPLSQEQALDEMLEVDDLTIRHFRSRLRFDFSDIPNVLCETDKHLRIKNGEGKMRAKYTPPQSGGFF